MPCLLRKYELIVCETWFPLFYACILSNIFLPLKYMVLLISIYIYIIIFSVLRPINYSQGMCGTKWYEVGRASANCSSSYSNCITNGISLILSLSNYQFGIFVFFIVYLFLFSITYLTLPKTNYTRKTLESHCFMGFLSMQSHFLRNLHKS